MHFGNDDLGPFRSKKFGHRLADISPGTGN
jgi:hypothetical protein